MKKLSVVVLSLFISYACNNGDPATTGEPENDLDAARTFIKNALEGKFEQARQIMLRDSTNDQTMDVIERNYEHMPYSEKNGYRNASIQIYNTRELSDSLKVVTYSNSYKNQKDSLKLVRVNGQWLVDLKFTFQPQQ